ncbi:FxsA family protein [Stomatohabitans albus]|uniref:FxsA family protein n=1 Tax=Stomatohabitans albus TaxID=3110766 RepID=UPI00300D7CED
MKRWLIPLALTVGVFVDWMLLSYLKDHIGLAFTLLIVVMFMPWGLYLQFSQGKVVRDQLVEAFMTGQRMPQAAMEGAMVMVGGMLMILPGVISSLLGLAFAWPTTRRLLSPLFVRIVSAQVSHGTIPASQLLNDMGATMGGGKASVVDANPKGAPRGRSRAAGYRRTTVRSQTSTSTGTRPTTPPSGATRPPRPGSRGTTTSSQTTTGHVTPPTGRSTRKSISAEVVSIERTQPRPTDGTKR